MLLKLTHVLQDASGKNQDLLMYDPTQITLLMQEPPSTTCSEGHCFAQQYKSSVLFYFFCF